jgi:periplasmic protein TonB
MKTKEKIETDLDEVIFEKRNKEYGAYYLRKTYDKNVSKALTITVTLLLLVVAIPLIANYLNDKPYFGKITDNGPGPIVLTPPDEEKKELPPPPPIKDLPVKIKLTEFVIVDDTNVTGDIPTQGDLNDQGKNEPINDGDVIKVESNQDDKKPIDDNADKVIDFTGVSEKPEFLGGVELMNKFIVDNVKYPDLARDYKIQGTVFLSFIVEPDGSLSDVKVLNGIGAGCDEEAERVVKIMPKWTPGKQNSKSVRVRVVIPMKFIIVE